MKAKLIAAILGVNETRQAQVISLIQESLFDFVHHGLYNEETMMQVLTVHTIDFTPQERAFAIYFVGRYVQLFLGGDEPLDKEVAVKQIYQMSS